MFIQQFSDLTYYNVQSCITQYGSTGYIRMVVVVYIALSVYTLGNCHFHLQLAVRWTHIYIIVTIPSKLRLVKNLSMGKAKMPFSESSSSSSG